MSRVSPFRPESCFGRCFGGHLAPTSTASPTGSSARSPTARRPPRSPGTLPDDRDGVILGSRTDHGPIGPGTGRAVLATSSGVRPLLLSHNIVRTTVNVAGSRTVLVLAR